MFYSVLFYVRSSHLWDTCKQNLVYEAECFKFILTEFVVLYSYKRFSFIVLVSLQKVFFLSFQVRISDEVVKNKKKVSYEYK